MEFWGVELKGDKPVKVVPEMSEVIHLSHATLAEIKKGGEPVMLYAKTGNQKLVIGVLKGDTIPQLSFDLVFKKEFELSHNWKNGCVHLTGYKSLMPDDDGEVYSDFSDEEAELALEENKQNGTIAAPAASKDKPAAIAAKKDEKPKDESDDSDEDDDDDDSDDESLESDKSDEEKAAANADDDSDDDDSDEDDSDEDESDEEEEETPVKSAADKKKRPASALQIPEAKKAKLVTPQKTDGGKKSAVVHVATPHPAKNAAKTPKAGGSQVTCGSCKKGFNSQGALDSHTKAKHSAAK